MWRTLPGILGNAAVLLVIGVVTVANITEGQWLYVGLALPVIAGFGVVPAIRAHQAGALCFTQDRGRSPRAKPAVPSLGQMAEDNADLARVEVEFPRLGSDSVESCPESIVDLLGYLGREVPGGEQLTPVDLVFLRTAQVESAEYWIWRFSEPDDGADAYATVKRVRGGAVTVGYDSNTYGLTPEQFILGDYREVF